MMDLLTDHERATATTVPRVNPVVTVLVLLINLLPTCSLLYQTASHPAIKSQESSHSGSAMPGDFAARRSDRPRGPHEPVEGRRAKRPFQPHQSTHPILYTSPGRSGYRGRLPFPDNRLLKTRHPHASTIAPQKSPRQAPVRGSREVPTSRQRSLGQAIIVVKHFH